MHSQTSPHWKPAFRAGGPAVADGFLIEDTPTGYEIEDLSPVPQWRWALQALLMIAGSVLISSAIAVLIFVPVDLFLYAVPPMLALFGLGLLTIRLASCGLTTFFQVDLVKRELRRVTMARTGARTRRERYPFEAFDSVFIDRSRPVARLCVRFAGKPGRIVLANGGDRELELLRDRLARDMLGESLH